MGKTSRCHIKIRYLWGKHVDILKIDIWEKTLMSYKNTISMGKTNRCHIKIRYLWGKQVDVLKDIYGKNYRCHIKIRYLCEKP